MFTGHGGPDLILTGPPASEGSARRYAGRADLPASRGTAPSPNKACQVPGRPYRVSMVAIEDVPAPLRLSFYLGEVVRNDNHAESELGALYRSFQEAGLAAEPMQRDFGRLIPQMRKLLGNERVPKPFAGVAIGALDFAGNAHRRRRELVHDLLTQDVLNANQVRSMRGRRPPRPMSELKNCADDLLTATWRIRGLWITAPYWIGGQVEEGHDASDLRSWTRVAMGHIADHPYATIGTEGEAPEPPGGWRTLAS